MDLSEAIAFLEENHRAVLATHRDVGLQTSPVLVGLDDKGRAVISSRETAYKTKNLSISLLSLERHPRSMDFGSKRRRISPEVRRRGDKPPGYRG